ncbi:cupin domain-containing protein [Sphingomonas sp. OK281]|uniref:cupin domain-containing protein n=1 Tax=Sphingomonas sp. OK281 TaxID=1881067 RepID=UPI0008ED23E7|nr:cupin domain-containing protein [Sphingomonas sp. OK281]SFO43205.1 Mannose-6-phosphate isomerase, cupin superfamily [Sphingomonas sp. OK281]
MTIDVININAAVLYRNPGKYSLQILSPDNAPEAKVTITRVTMAPGALSTMHSHDHAEQIWIIEQGEGTVLLADGMSSVVSAGQLVRTPPRTEHGLKNIGKIELVYLSITTPPENMAKFYVDHQPRRL